MFAAYAVIVILFAMLLHYKWKRKRMVKMMNQFQGPPMKPFFGNALKFTADARKALEAVKTTWQDYESPSRMWFVHKPYVLIYSPEDFQAVAWKTLEKNDSYQFIVDMLGDGIFTSKVEKWRSHRKLLNGAFNPIFLKEYFVEIFNHQNIKLVERLKKEVGSGKHFNLWPYFIHTSINTISQTAMGCEESFSEETIMEFGNVIIRAAEIVSKRICQPWLHPSFIFTIYKYLRGCGNIFEFVHSYPLQMLNLKKKQIELDESEIKDNQMSGLKDKSLRNFIGILLDARSKHYLSDQELQDEIISIMFGGSETNAVTAGFLLLMLAMQQDVQEKVYQELYQVFGDSSRLPDLEDMSRLPFLEQCIKETLRRFPIVPVIFRYAKTDVSISNNYVIPEGANIILCIAALHHNPKIYPDPLSWNPENFTPEKEATRHKCAFVPFSTGPRGCIGQKYAWTLLKIQLSTILRNFRFYTDVKMEEIELNVDFIIRSKHGYNVKLEYRHNKSLF